MESTARYSKHGRRNPKTKDELGAIQKIKNKKPAEDELEGWEEQVVEMGNGHYNTSYHRQNIYILYM